MKRDRKSRLWALVATVAFHVAVVVALLSIYLTYPPASEETREWPPVDSAEMLFGGEYVRIGDTPEPAESSESPEPAEIAEVSEPSESSAPTPAAPEPVITTERPSKAKTEKTGPTKAEKEAAEKARREAEQRKAIQDRLKKTDFGSKGGGEGKTGQQDGNSTSGAASGTPGFNLRGRTLAYYEQPPRGPLGTITIRVSVNRRGEVTSAEYSSGTGSAAASTAARNHCINAARKSRFSVDENAAASQVGTITYKFR